MLRHLVFRSLALIATVLTTGRSSSEAFTAPSSPPGRARSNGLGASGDDDDAGGGDPLFFDDFDDFGDVGGDGRGAADAGAAGLRARVRRARDAAAARDARLARNWRRGNWSVRGFALDGADGGAPTATAAAATTATTVSAVAAPASASGWDDAPPAHADRRNVVAVGRTDGSVFVIRLGEEYLTKFVAVPKLVVARDDDVEGRPDADDGVSGLSARVENEWMDAEAAQDRRRGEEGTGAADPATGATGGEDPPPPTPFEIVHRLEAAEGGAAVHSLVLDDTLAGDGGGLLCAAAGDAGDIRVWTLPPPRAGAAPARAALLAGVHADRIVALRTLTLPSPAGAAPERRVLFSASREGACALWDLERDLGRDAAPLAAWRCAELARDGAAELTCADVSNPTAWDEGDGDGAGHADALFLGTSHGYVLGYAVRDLLSAAAAGLPPEPNLRFRAHGTDAGGRGEAVTALACGGDGTIPSSARLRGAPGEGGSRAGLGGAGVASFILLTGGEDGAVKQWEILSQRSSSSSSSASIRMEHWPRLSTQRMRRRAHLFPPGHAGPVTAIARPGGRDAATFLTCGRDGAVRAWDAAAGRALFDTGGFSRGLSSLACLGRELLVTDGREGHVCVHDFGGEEDAAAAGYGADW